MNYRGGDGRWGDATQRAEIFLDGVSYRFYRGGKFISMYSGGSGEGRLLFEHKDVLVMQARILELIKGKTVTFK